MTALNSWTGEPEFHLRFQFTLMFRIPRAVSRHPSSRGHRQATTHHPSPGPRGAGETLFAPDANWEAAVLLVDEIFISRRKAVATRQTHAVQPVRMSVEGKYCTVAGWPS